MLRYLSKGILIWATYSVKHFAQKKITKTEAKKKGLVLGNTELYYYENKVKKNIYVNSEEEIFKYLGLQYISPEKR